MENSPSARDPGAFQQKRKVSRPLVRTLREQDWSGRPRVRRAGGITMPILVEPSRARRDGAASPSPLRLGHEVLRGGRGLRDRRGDETSPRAAFDDVYLTVVVNDAPGARPPLPADSTRFAAVSAKPKKVRWGPHLVDPPTLSISVLGPDLRPHKSEVVPECSSLEDLQVDVLLKTPYDEEDLRAYPLQPISLAGDGDLGPRPPSRWASSGRRPGTQARADRVAPGSSIGVLVIGERASASSGLRSSTMPASLADEEKESV